MNDPETGVLERNLKGIHRGVLLLLVGIAATLALGSHAGDSVPPAPLVASGIALALGIVFSRALAQSRRMPRALRPLLIAQSLLCAALLGLVGLTAAWVGTASRTGLGFALGALILAIRPPRFADTPPSTSPPPTRRDRPAG